MKNRLISIALAGGVFLGCCSAINSSETKNSGLEKYRERLAKAEDTHTFKKCLREGEYAISDDIFSAYVCAGDPALMDICAFVIGGYIVKNPLDTDKKMENFLRDLKLLVLDEEERKFYLNLLTSRDIIIFRESTLAEGEQFFGMLPHERMHQKLNNLSAEKREVLRLAAEELVGRKYTFEQARELGYPAGELIISEIMGLESIPFLRDKRNGFAVQSSELDWEEFYPYLEQGNFVDRVEIALRTDYPLAYELFTELRRDSKLDKGCVSIKVNNLE